MTAKFTRREFLTLVGIEVATTAAALAGCADWSPGPTKIPTAKAEALPIGVPPDTLTKEQLARKNITIYQSPETRLYLRQSALNLPVLKDAAEGRLGGTTICLVNNGCLSWNAISRLAEIPPKAVWQKIVSSPQKKVTGNWDGLRESYQISLESSQKSLSFWQERLEDVTVGTERQRYEDNLKRLSTLKPKDDDRQKYLDSLNEQKMTLEQEEENIRHWISYEKGFIQKTNGFVNAFAQGQTTAIAYFAEYDGPEGQYIKTRFSPKSDSFQGQQQVFIYLAVGGDYKPNPSQSYPRPDQFEVNKYPSRYLYNVFPKGEISPGFILAHETGHYNPNQEFINDYYDGDADNSALDLITAAWQKYQQTGDNGGYPFVFVNDQGITITKNTQGQPNNSG